MSDLDEVLGAIVASVARARVLADEETIAIAEEYKDHPLLRGMSIPRVRLPDVTIELPVVVEGHEGGGDGQSESPTRVKAAVSEELKSAMAEFGIAMPRGMSTALSKAFDTQLRRRVPKAVQARQIYGTAADRALISVMGDQRFAEKLTKVQLSDLQGRLRQRARETAVKVVPTEGKFKINVATSAVKNEADPSNITRLRISLREEGLEWALYEREDGSEGQSLSPE